MEEKVRFLGLDVHAETIAVAVAEADGEVRSLGTRRNEGNEFMTFSQAAGFGTFSPLDAAPGVPCWAAASSMAAFTSAPTSMEKPLK